MKKCIRFLLIFSCVVINTLYCGTGFIDNVAIKSNMSSTVTVEKLRVIDCRAVRGFLGTPIDGSVVSWGYRGAICEYPDTGIEGYDAGAGVDYRYNNNDGIHITFADSDGFDYVVLRGGAHSRMYADVSTLTEPQNKRPIYEFKGGSAVETTHFDSRIKAGKVSFFGTDSGALADIGFYRLSFDDLEDGEFEVWVPENNMTELLPPETEFAPESLYLAMKERYGERTDYHLMKKKVDGISLHVPRNRALHLITPPFAEERYIDSITLDMTVSGADEFSCTVAVQDPLNPRLDLMYVPFVGKGQGSYRLNFDIPDQALFPGSQLWITLDSDSDIELSGPDGGAPNILLYYVPKATVLKDVFAYRMFLMKSYFCILCEPRQWGSYRKQSRQELYRRIRYGKQYAELFMTLDQCHLLNPEDDTLRQYREWIYLRNLDNLSAVSPPPEPPDGVPAWAWYPRLAWLKIRRIVEWWLDNRLVPTGEFGGMVGDDTDFYQQAADLPYFESGGVAGRLKDGAARLAELADKENLRGGINILTTDGLHAYEEGINHLALMARWNYGDPIYIERCMASAQNMEKMTMVTADGRRHFRNIIDLGYNEIKHPQKPATDGGSTALLWHATLQAADYNRNPGTLNALIEWADTWLKYMKPGNYATSIDVSSGKVLQADKTLPFTERGQIDTFLWLYALTGETRFIEPLLSLLQKSGLAASGQRFVDELYNLNALDNLPEYSIKSLAERNPAINLYTTKDAGPIIETIIGDPNPSGSAISCLYDTQRWPDMFTSSEQYTDRLFYNRLLEYASICYLGGYCGRGKFNPTTAVSWEGFDTNFGALVLENHPDRLTVAIYSYADKPLKGSVRVWALEHGKYRIITGIDDNGDFSIDSSQELTERELARADKVQLTISPKSVTVLRLEKIEKLDPIYLRPDLAVTARELVMKDDVLSGTIHNIGSAAVEDVIIGLVDSQGTIIAKRSLGRLDAPHVLVPKTLSFTLPLPSGKDKGMKFMLDPEQRIPELYEGNNTVKLDELPAANYANSWE